MPLTAGRCHWTLVSVVRRMVAHEMLAGRPHKRGKIVLTVDGQ
jgi:hypothetical protein